MKLIAQNPPPSGGGFSSQLLVLFDRLYALLKGDKRAAVGAVTAFYQLMTFAKGANGAFFFRQAKIFIVFR